MTNQQEFQVGDPAPWFKCRASNNPVFNFYTTAGRYLVLCFFGSTAVEKNAGIVRYMTDDLRPYFDDAKISFFGISIDPDDEAKERVKQSLPGIRYFWDFDRKVSKQYRMVDPQASESGPVEYRSRTLVLDPMQRVIANIPLTDPVEHNKTLTKLLSKLPEVDLHAQVPVHAPVLILPRIFEPEFCRELIAQYERDGGHDSGFMRNKGEKTVGVVDHSFKRRKDFNFDEQPEFESLRNGVRTRISKRLVPEIKKVFQFKVTHMERYLVACYEAEAGGFFKAHRDDTTKSTAHRKFACTINLNTEEYEGGDLRFPEFGTRTYRAPTGGAVVFSCTLLHEATPVTKGRRYACLPFLYDEASAKLREESQQFLELGAAEY